MKNYLRVLPDLISKIQPIKGKLYHRLSTNHYYEGFIGTIWITFVLENFTFNDPFYGMTEVIGDGVMFFETTAYDKKIVLIHLFDIEGKSFEYENNDFGGSLGNTFKFIIKKCKFGYIKNRKIKFEMDYFFTNSSSYGEIDGTIEDHAELMTSLSTELFIEDAFFEDVRKKRVKPLKHFIDPNIYDLNKIEKTDLDHV